MLLALREAPPIHAREGRGRAQRPQSPHPRPLTQRGEDMNTPSRTVWPHPPDHQRGTGSQGESGEMEEAPRAVFVSVYGVNEGGRPLHRTDHGHLASHQHTRASVATREWQSQPSREVWLVLTRQVF